jgi:hypothetical protein
VLAAFGTLRWIPRTLSKAFPTGGEPHANPMIRDTAPVTCR